MSYELNLITQDGAVLSIPVLPSKLCVKSPGRNEKIEVLEIGEVSRVWPKGLRSLEWESHFPIDHAYYVTTPTRAPIEMVKLIQGVRDRLQPLRFQLLGQDLDINVDMTVDDFEYETRGGEPGDLYYSIQLTEYRENKAASLNLRDLGKGEASITEDSAPRSGAPPVPKSYTVHKGDSLWAIARRFYGNGTKWKTLYDANKSVVGANPNKIYPGQVLSIP